MYVCHNCGASIPLGLFLENEFPAEAQEYRLEKYTETNPVREKPTLPEILVPKFAPKDFLQTNAVRIDQLSEDHPARKYVGSRRIKFGDLWYTDKFGSLAQKFDESYNNIPEEPRLVIPFRSKNGELNGFQGRALNKKSMRYITIKKDPDEDIVFGLDRVNLNKTVFVLEGALDSTFLPNAIVASIS